MAEYDIKIVSQDFVNRHYRGYFTREQAYAATRQFFYKCLISGTITEEEFIQAQKFNQIAFDNNQQDIPVG